jgi:hypothetical protein
MLYWYMIMEKKGTTLYTILLSALALVVVDAVCRKLLCDHRIHEVAIILTQIKPQYKQAGKHTNTKFANKLH